MDEPHSGSIDVDIALDAAKLNDGRYRKEFDEIPAKPLTVLALAAGKWIAFYAATLLDGSAGAVMHWVGEVER